MTSIRAIALLMTLAVLLAGPASSLAGLIDDDCRCTLSTAQIDDKASGSCCDLQTEQTDDRAPSQDNDDQQCPGDCDCCVSCSAMSKPVPLNRNSTSFFLPDRQPDTFAAVEPQNHAIEPHFLLLRPPRS